MDLAYRVVGDDTARPAVLQVHGAAEDAEMLDLQAEAISQTGRRVIWYDRRGTGASTRDDWPGSGADQHADDAARLLRQLDAAPALILGFSSGGVVALALAARHPELVDEAVVWEAPAVTVLPDGYTLQAQMMAGAEEHLRAHPDDWVGAFFILMTAISSGEADLGSQAVLRMARNAEASVRDDGRLIVRRSFGDDELPADRVTIAVGEQADPLHVAIAQRLSALVDRPVIKVPGADEHEIYLTRPEVLARWIESRSRTRKSSAA